MRLLRGSRRPEMYRLLAEEIGRISTLDLCCGEAELRRWLSHDRYQGIDKNPFFAAELRRRGIPVIEEDVLAAPWPAADCLVMVDSLYHFLPEIDRLMDKAVAFPGNKVIFSESIENLTTHTSDWVSKISAWATRVDGQSYPRRFSEDTLGALFRKHGFQRTIKTGANLIGILER